MATLREIVAEMGLEFDSEAFEEAEHHVKSLKEGLKAVGGVLTGVVAAFAGTTIAVAEHAHRLYDSAVAAGVNVETFQKLGFAAQESGADVDTMSQALVFLSRQAEAAKNGNKEAAEHFAKAGVKVTDASGQLRNAGDIFRDFADKSKNMTNSTERTALAAELLGRNAGPRLQQLMARGSEGIDEMGNELEELGGLMDEEFVQQSKEFTESLGRVKVIGEGMARVLAQTFMPAMKGVIDAFVAWYKINRQIIASGIQHTVSAITNTVELLASAFSWGFDKVRALFDAFGEFKGMALLLAAAIAVLAATFLLPFGPIVLLGALVALVFDDINHWLKGQPSLIGDVIKAWDDLLEIDPTDNGFVAFLKDASKFATDLARALGEVVGLVKDKGTLGKIFGYDQGAAYKGGVLEDTGDMLFGNNRQGSTAVAGSYREDSAPRTIANQNVTVNVTAAAGREREAAGAVVDALNTGSKELRAAHARFAPRVGK